MHTGRSRSRSVVTNASLPRQAVQGKSHAVSIATPLKGCTKHPHIHRRTRQEDSSHPVLLSVLTGLQPRPGPGWRTRPPYPANPGGRHSGRHPNALAAHDPNLGLRYNSRQCVEPRGGTNCPPRLLVSCTLYLKTLEAEWDGGREALRLRSSERRQPERPVTNGVETQNRNGALRSVRWHRMSIECQGLALCGVSLQGPNSERCAPSPIEAIDQGASRGGRKRRD